MSSGAFALYIDQKAGEGSLERIDRIVPLPRLGNHDGIHFDHRRLTISYDDLPPTAVHSITVTGRFIGVTGSPINATINAGECHVITIPPDACAASIQVQPPPAGNVRGPIAALVEYS
jgi:hypothetical protein